MSEGIVTQRTIATPGTEAGTVGDAGVGRDGATIRVVAVSPVMYIGSAILGTYLDAFFGLLTIDGLGLADLAPPGEAFTHLWHIGGIALAPTLLSLGRELLKYLNKIRASQQA